MSPKKHTLSKPLSPQFYIRSNTTTPPRSSAPTTIASTSSRKSAPSVTSKRQRKLAQAHKLVHNPDLKRAGVPAPSKAQANAAKGTSSTRSSKSSTKTRKSSETICRRLFQSETVAGSTQKKAEGD